MFVRSVIMCSLFAAIFATSAAQVSHRNRWGGGRHNLMPMDTLANKPNEGYVYTDVLDKQTQADSQKFYDSLKSKSGQRKFTKFLYNLLIRGPQRDTTLQGRLVDEAAELQRYAGRTIGSIDITCLDVFENAHSFVQKAANKIHVVTRENVIRRDLFFKPGEEIVPDEIVRTSQLLRSRDYLSDLWMDFIPRQTDTMIVDIKIVTRDSWSIGVNASMRDEKRAHLDVYDANILGSGNRLSVQTNYAWGDNRYGGSMFEYNVPNVLGTFMTANVVAGKEFEDTRLDLELRKDLYTPNDYEFGIAYNDDKIRFYQLYLNDYTYISYKNWDAWLGFSKSPAKWKSSAYMIGRYQNGTFDRRPEVGPRFNPRFHGYETALVGMGFYREKFYAANLIYGFGRKEYLPTGYRLDLTLGYNWGEFHEDYYVALNYRRGGYTGIGYFMGDGTVGTFIDHRTGKLWQSIADVNIRWFSNLFVAGRSRMRQFVNINYTHGWNRGEGNDEFLSFTKESGPRSLRDYFIGRTRAVINTETVLFTPLHPLGFQVALFAYLDAGTIGEDHNIFKNDFYTSFGVGVRLRNERLIFKTIQIRLGLALGRGGLVNNRYVQLSTEQRIQQYRFIPTRPQILEMTTIGSVKKRDKKGDDKDKDVSDE